MNYAQVVTELEATGLRFVRPIHPISWNGDANCFIGPFSSIDVANNFARQVVAVKCKFAFKLIPKRGHWYVQVGDVKVIVKNSPPRTIVTP